MCDSQRARVEARAALRAAGRSARLYRSSAFTINSVEAAPPIIWDQESNLLHGWSVEQQVSCCPDWEKREFQGEKTTPLSNQNVTATKNRLNLEVRIEGQGRTKERGEERKDGGNKKEETLNSSSGFTKANSAPVQSPLMLITRESNAGESRANRNS